MEPQARNSTHAQSSDDVQASSHHSLSSPVNTGAGENTSKPRLQDHRLSKETGMNPDRCDGDSSDSEPGSVVDPKTLGIKPLAAFSKPCHSNPPASIPSLDTQPEPAPRKYSFKLAKLSNHKLADVKLSPPASPANMEDADWDFTETREEISAEDESEDWEEIEAKVFDHATGAFGEIPSVVYEDESFRQTLSKFMGRYTEMCTPSYDTKRKFYSAMYLLKTVGELGYICVKEPLVEWADQIALNLLEMPMDQASAAITAELLMFLPERTKMAYHRLRGVAGLSSRSLEEVSSNKKPTLLFPTDRSLTEERFIRNLVTDIPFDELSIQSTPSKIPGWTTVNGPLPWTQLPKEKPIKFHSASRKSSLPNQFQQQPTTATKKELERLASDWGTIAAKDKEIAEQKETFKREMLPLPPIQTQEQLRKVSAPSPNPEQQKLVLWNVAKAKSPFTISESPPRAPKTTAAGLSQTLVTPPLSSNNIPSTKTILMATTGLTSVYDTRSAENPFKPAASSSNVASTIVNMQQVMPAFGNDVSTNTEY